MYSPKSSEYSSSYDRPTTTGSSNASLSSQNSPSFASGPGGVNSEAEMGYRSDGGLSYGSSRSDFSARVSDCGNSIATDERSSHPSEKGETISRLLSEGRRQDLSSSGTSRSSLSSGSESTASSSTLLSDTPATTPIYLTQVRVANTKRSLPAAGILVSLGNNKPQGIIEAAKTGDNQLARKLLSEGCDLSAVDSNKRTALHIACSLGRLEIARLLIAAGSNVDACSRAGQTPLHEACIGGHFEVIKELLPEVSDLDAVDTNGLSASHYCAMNGEADCLELLCNQGCDICLEDRQGRTGVHLAAMKDHTNGIQCLLDRGMELDCEDMDGKTPSHYACRYGSLECLKQLVRCAADIKAGDCSGVKPVHDAAYYDQLPCLKFLLRGKAGRGVSTDNEGRNVLHKAAQGGATSCLHWLLETGMNVNSTDRFDNTALHYSAKGGHSQCFYCLLQHGASLSAANLTGETPLDAAKRTGKSKAINKAVEGVERCSNCQEKKAQLKQTQSTSAKTSSIQRAIHVGQQTLFTNPVPSNIARSKKVHLASQSKILSSTTTKTTLPKRNLAAKYYGPLP